MTDRIEKTRAFVEERLKGSPYFQKNPGQFSYRYEHTLRVSALGAKIARADGLDEEKLVLGCLLHDVSYGREFVTPAEWRGHGRDSALIARPWLEGLGVAPETVEDLCQAIAVHVDGKPEELAALSTEGQMIVICDNLDRLDAYRIYDGMEMRHFSSKTISEQIAWVRRYLHDLEELAQVPVPTPTAARLWKERLDFQKVYYERLLEQLTFPAEYFGAECLNLLGDETGRQSEEPENQRDTSH